MDKQAGLGRHNLLDLIGWMPGFYVLFAFLNFLIGAILGASMTVQVSLWPLLRPVHAELNPFGWLTMMIYGMTYAVLTISAGLRPNRNLGWLQLVVAECGVWLIASSALIGSIAVYRIGLALQTIAPFLFLLNILLAVRAAHRTSNLKEDSSPASDETRDTSRGLAGELGGGLGDKLNNLFPPLPANLVVYRFVGRSEVTKSTDKVGQRGTDIALMIFLVSVTVTFISAFFDKSTEPYMLPPVSEVLTYYGWILGTVLAVSLHLFPRYGDMPTVKAWQATIAQMTWLLGVVAATIGTMTSPLLLDIGTRLLGIALFWTAAYYLWFLPRLFRGIPIQIKLAWTCSWCFAGILGFALITGLNATSVLALHILFLGCITTLIYGVGYTFFPILLRRIPRWKSYSVFQVCVALVGATVMLVGLAGFTTSYAQFSMYTLLPIGGVLSALGFILFLVQWPFARKIRSN